MTKSVWLLAAVITVLVALSEASIVIRLVPGISIVDVSALIITGFLAGLFAGFHLTQSADGTEPEQRA